MGEICIVDSRSRWFRRNIVACGLLIALSAFTAACGRDGAVTAAFVGRTEPPDLFTPTVVSRVTPTTSRAPNRTPTKTPTKTPARTPTQTPNASNCCVDRSDEAGCDNSACESCVCGNDDFCCDAEAGFWDVTCVAIAADNCFADCGCAE